MTGISDTAAWFEAAKKAGFGLILPSGWYGKPWDGALALEEYRIEAGEFYLRFRERREVIIVTPKSIVLDGSEDKRTLLKFSEFERVELRRISQSEPEKIFMAGEVVLVGYGF